MNLLFIIPLATKAGSEIKVNVQLGTKRDSRVSMDIENEFNQINWANFYVDSTDKHTSQLHSANIGIPFSQTTCLLNKKRFNMWTQKCMLNIYKKSYNVESICKQREFLSTF